MKRAPVTAAQIAAAERVLSVGTWAITAGAVLYSVLTVTPLVMRVTPAGWDWTSPLLPLVVDAAVIVSVRLDATVARLGERGGGWATLLRWMTGLMTLLLNVGDSALKHDGTGVAVHSVIPLILIVIADAGLAWRRAIGRAQDRIEREQRAEEERSRAEREAREQQQRADREREQDRREQAAREEREHADRRAREQADRDREERREAREAEERLQQQRLASEERRQQAERDERERARQEDRERADREREEQQQRERAARAEQDRLRREADERRDRAARERAQQRTTPTPAPREQRTQTPVNTNEQQPVNKQKLPEDQARAAVRDGAGTQTVRQLADDTGWSTGWVQKRIAELADELVGTAAGGGEQ